MTPAALGIAAQVAALRADLATMTTTTSRPRATPGQAKAAARAAACGASDAARAAARRIVNGRGDGTADHGRAFALATACNCGAIICARDLWLIALRAGWETTDTGRPLLEICRPLARAGLLAELNDDSAAHIGYTLTSAGAAALMNYAHA